MNCLATTKRRREKSTFAWKLLMRPASKRLLCARSLDSKLTSRSLKSIQHLKIVRALGRIRRKDKGYSTRKANGLSCRKRRLSPTHVVGNNRYGRKGKPRCEQCRAWKVKVVIYGSSVHNSASIPKVVPRVSVVVQNTCAAARKSFRGIGDQR